MIPRSGLNKVIIHHSPPSPKKMMPLNPWTMKWNTSSWPGHSQPLTNPPDLKHHPSPNPLPMAIWVRKKSKSNDFWLLQDLGQKILRLAKKNGKKTCTIPFKNQHLFLNCVALKYCQNWRSEVLQTLWIELHRGMGFLVSFHQRKKWEVYLT